MYCNNCGNQFEDGQRFCSKCGNEVTKKNEELKCPHCGKDIGEGKRFCVYCGGSLADVGKKKYCQYCGNELESEEHFCKNCGHRVESRAVNVSLENFGGSVKNFVSSGVSNIKSTVGKSFVDSSFESRFTLGHYILAALAALSLLFCALPFMRIDVSAESFFVSMEMEANVSWFNPFGELSEIFEEFMEDEQIDAIKASFTFLSLLIILPTVGSLIMSLLPMVNNTVMRRRRFLLQKFSAGSSLGGTIAMGVYSSTFVSSAGLGKSVHVGLTFCGWILILLNIAIAILAYYLSSQSAKNMGVKNEFEDDE